MSMETFGMMPNNNEQSPADEVEELEGVVEHREANLRKLEDDLKEFESSGKPTRGDPEYWGNLPEMIAQEKDSIEQYKNKLG